MLESEKKLNPARRDFLLKQMPKNSIGAKIGVWKSIFTN